MHSGGSLWWRVVRAHGYAVLVIGVFLGALPWIVLRSAGQMPMTLSFDTPLSALGYVGLILAPTGGALSAQVDFALGRSAQSRALGLPMRLSD